MSIQPSSPAQMAQALSQIDEEERLRSQTQFNQLISLADTFEKLDRMKRSNIETAAKYGTPGTPAKIKTIPGKEPVEGIPTTYKSDVSFPFFKGFKKTTQIPISPEIEGRVVDAGTAALLEQATPQNEFFVLPKSVYIKKGKAGKLGTPATTQIVKEAVKRKIGLEELKIKSDLFNVYGLKDDTEENRKKFIEGDIAESIMLLSGEKKGKKESIFVDEITSKNYNEIGLPISVGEYDKEQLSLVLESWRDKLRHKRNLRLEDITNMQKQLLGARIKGQVEKIKETQKRTAALESMVSPGIGVGIGNNILTEKEEEEEDTETSIRDKFNLKK